MSTKSSLEKRNRVKLDWRRFIQALTGVAPGGKLFACPLHPFCASETMRVNFHPVSLDPWFSCIDANCRFEGDAVALLALVRGITHEEAAGLFEYGEFEGMSPGFVAQVHNERRRDNEAIAGFVSACRVTLAGDGGALTFLGRLGLPGRVQFLPYHVGAIPERGVPLSFRNEKPGSIIFPYFHGPRVVGADILDESGALFYRTISETPGVFNPQGGMRAADTGVLYVFDNPLDMCRAYHAHAAQRAAAPAMVSTRRWPLPPCVPEPVRVVLVDTGSLDTDWVLHAYAGGAMNGVNCELAGIARLKREMADTDIADMENSALTPCCSWLGSRDGIGAAVAAVPMNDDKKAAIVAASGDGFTPSGDSMSRDIDVGGTRFLSRPDGIYHAMQDGSVDKLCNIGLRVDGRTVVNGKVLYDCTLRAREWTRGTIPHSRTANACRLSETAVALTGCGDAWFVNRPPKPWHAIIQALSEGVPETREPALAGVQENGDIELPYLAVRRGVFSGGGAAKKARNAGMWSGVRYATACGADAATSLMLAADDPLQAGYLLGLLHVLGCLSLASRAARSGNAIEPRRLLLCNKERLEWLMCAQAIARTLGGDGTLHRAAPGRKGTATVYDFTGMSGATLQEWLRTREPLALGMTSMNRARSARMDRTWYVATRRRGAVWREPDIEAARKALCWILSKLRDMPDSEPVCLSAYDHLEGVLGMRMPEQRRVVRGLVRASVERKCNS